ncbi:MAG: GlsB/YeaQ/YmgE family stress response membrane protein [Chloroflexi bacterium]|nr:GlsB/YeaQ/YmgE family stress response membrane protein [Chloroflexota bacterium]
MGWLSWIVVGLIAGWLAGRVMRGGGYGLIGDIIVGVLGGLLGGWIATSLLHIGAGVNGINLESIVVAFAGAVILLILLRLLGGGRRRSILR